MPERPFPFKSIICGLWLLLVAVVPIGLQAEPPRDVPEGLMWNRTGLPAVFPLQVRTNAGRDYLLTLRDARTGEDALAAYVRGGRFFRVLVPPGRYTLHFASGVAWLGERDRFGERTRTFTLDEALTFGVRDFSTKAGHLVDLSGLDQPGGQSGDTNRVRVRPQLFCQSLRFDFGPSERWFAPPPLAGGLWRIEADGPVWGFPHGPSGSGPLFDAAALGPLPPPGSDGLIHPPAPRKGRRPEPYPRYEIRQRPC